MDKITRILLMYSRLMNGEHINKLSFSMETECNPRSFDRDIEDIRLFLSETFQGEELVYDRQDNAYYLNGFHKGGLETEGFTFIERILLDSGVLRADEMENLLERLSSNTEKVNLAIAQSHKAMEYYNEPKHNKALLKMHSDLSISIQNRCVIRLNCHRADGEMQNRIVIPCLLKYDTGYIYFAAYEDGKDGTEPDLFRLDEIHSFVILRSQSEKEKGKVSLYLQQQKQRLIEDKE